MTPQDLFSRAMHLILLVVCAVMIAMPVVAREPCFDDAGEQHRIDPLLLKAIAEVESAMNPRAINRNQNGSEDIGIMQINSSHLSRLNDAGITREALLNDACLSVMVGADILSGLIARFGYTWRAVGAYNAGNGSKRDWLREHYAIRVARAYRRLVGDFNQAQKEKLPGVCSTPGLQSETHHACP